MKIVREHINEKFEEQSDPIRDMGIGHIPEKEVKKLAKILESKLQEMFTNDVINVKVSSVGQNRYDMSIKFKSGYYAYIGFSGSFDIPVYQRIPLESNYLQGIGWYTMRNDKFVEPYDFDALILEIFRLMYNSGREIQSSINGQIMKLERAKKEKERLEKSIETAKIIQQYLR